MSWLKNSPFTLSATKNRESELKGESTRAAIGDATLEQSVPGEEGEMSGLEQELGLSLGVLIDVVDEQWMRDTLPAEGASPPFPFVAPVT